MMMPAWRRKRLLSWFQGRWDDWVCFVAVRPVVAVGGGGVRGEHMRLGMKMKACYSARDVRIYQGDAVAVMDMLADECVDLIFADPPYNLSNGGYTCHAGRRASVSKGDWDKSRGVEEDFLFHSDWIRACRRILKPNGSLWVSGTYHSIYICGFALQRQGWHLINDICWFKPNAAPNLACRMFTASHETLLWVRKDKKAKHFFNYDLVKNGEWPDDFLKRDNRQMRSVWAIGTPKGVEKKHGRHPTQKPEALLDRIVLACSGEGDVVFDPFCGSAATGASALRNGRKFVGVDRDRDYLDKIAIPKIKEAVRHLDAVKRSGGKAAALP